MDFGKAPASHDPYAALRIPGFRRLLMASMLGTIANEMQAVAVAWELYERTGQTLALGLVGLVQVVPVLVLALPAGHAADRFPRKALMIATQGVLAMAALLLAAITWGRGPIVGLYAALGLAGTALAVALPARASILPQVVPTSLFANAVAWRTSGWQLAAVTGPALGGAGLAMADRAGVPKHLVALPIYLTSAALCCTVIALLVGMRTRPQKHTRDAMNWESLLTGVRFVRSNPLILSAITLDMFAVLFGGATFLLPVFAKDILAVGPTGFGWLRAAPSLGAVVMALFIAHRPPLRTAGRTLLASVAGFGVATLVFGISRNVWLSFAALAIGGALDNISVVIRGTLVQTLTPDAMRGRVAAVNSVFVGLSNELGGFESGATAQVLGAVGSVILGGVGCLAVVGLTAWRWPALAHLKEIKAPPGGPHVPTEVRPSVPLEALGPEDTEVPDDKVDHV